METPDPHAALTDSSVAIRSAGLRDLARHGTWEDLARIVEVGWGDKSVPVRLYAAAAAADLIARKRGAWGQEPMNDIQAAQVLSWAFQQDPGTNPSMLMLAGLVDKPESLRRLQRILRDPRSDVRLGAVTALRRMVLSSVGDVEAVATLVETALADDRLADDTRLELVRLVGEAGLSSLRQRVVRTRSRGEAFAEVADVALDRLSARETAAAWSGMWRTDGLDVFELALEPRCDELLVTGEALAFTTGERLPLVRGDDGVRIGDEPARLVWATPLGTHEAALALQVGLRTWWQVPAGDAPDLLGERYAEVQAMGEEAAEALKSWVANEEGAGGQRARIVVAWLAGDHEDALAELDPLLSRKRPRTDLYWWRARVLADLGRAKDAIADLDVFLDKTKPGQAFHETAAALKAELS